jgi:hypothetical protein
MVRRRRNGDQRRTVADVGRPWTLPGDNGPETLSAAGTPKAAAAIALASSSSTLIQLST